MAAAKAPGTVLEAQTAQPLTPAQAMYDILASFGFVHQKVGFARIVSINDRNIYSYLGNPESDKIRGFIPASIEKLHGWAHAILRETGVQIEIHLLPDGDLVLLATGNSKNGAPFGPMRYRTTYGRSTWGFKPAAPEDDDFGAAAEEDGTEGASVS